MSNHELETDMKFHRVLYALYFGRILYTTLLAAIATLLPSQSAFADVVLDWNEVGAAAVGASGQRPPDGARAMAMMHVAMFDAINAIEQKYQPSADSKKAPKNTSADAAAAAAASTVLAKLFPDQSPAIENAYGGSLAKTADSDAKTAGIALGRDVGAQCLTLRTNDG